MRGTIIHGVLERIQEEAELAELLDVTVSALDQPELEEQLAVGTAYRQKLEEEIRGVVQSEEWQWYVDGEHYRELQFVHLVHSGKWRVGALDLYRPGEPNVVIDFKTHDITTEEAAAKEATKYSIQGAVYRAAVGKLAGEVEARLHFTRGNVVVEFG